ncbi:MAG: putative bifunctional diguanylate cyclase/phosphodiesterase [Actinomycetes bacterium]
MALAAAPLRIPRPPRLLRPLRLYVVGMTLTLLGLLGCYTLIDDSDLHRRVSDASFVVAPLVAATTCLAAAVRRPRQRRAWGWLSVACAVWCLGGAAWFVDEILWHDLTPVGSLPAFAFVAYGVPAILGLTSFPVPHPRRGSRAWQLLDVVIVWLAVFLIGWVLVLSPGLQPGMASSGGLVSHLVASLYPISDIGVAAVVLVRGMRAAPGQRRMWLAFGAGLLCISLTDTVYAAQLVGGGFWSGSLLDLGWVLAFLLIGLAPLLPRPPLPERRPRALLQDSLPYAPVVLTIVVLAVRHPSLHPTGLTLWLCAALLVAVATRHLLATRDHLALAEELEDKVRARTAELERQAFHDELTGLLSRSRFLALVERAVRERPVHEVVENGVVTIRFDDPQTLLYLDLDGFTAVNDGFGHAVGDQLLLRVAERLTATVADGQLLARLGGDEFAVLLPGDAHRGEALGARLLGALTAPFSIDGRSLTVTGSVGVVSADGPCTGATELLRCADTALYAAKAAGRNRCVAFRPEMHAAVMDRLELEHDLRMALRNDELFVMYQPVLDLATGCLRGAEALVRWRHAQRGLVSPAEFVPVAEQTGLIEALGRLVLEEACGELAIWQEMVGRRDLRVSVNVSPTQLGGGLVNDVARVLARNGLSPSCLTLELTESAVAEDSEDVRLTIRLFKQLGVRLSVDDFGTGYSSLVRLRSFDFDELKVDRTFVADLGHGDEALVSTQIALAHGLGMVAVAEGVETERELECLARLGCDEVQGYLLGRPMSAEDFRRLLVEQLRPAALS